MNGISRSEEAYQSLRRRIRQLPAGTHLSIRSCAAELGMSSTPVREAFLRLEQEGSLRQVSNVGFFTQEYDFSALSYYYQVRECLEPFVLENAFELLTPEDLQEMAQHLDESSEELRREDYTEYVRCDIAFHEVIFRRYGNPHFSTLYHSIREQNMSCSQDLEAVSSYAIADHRQILEKIRTGDKAGAVDCMRVHIEHAKAKMLQGFVRFFQ